MSDFLNTMKTRFLNLKKDDSGVAAIEIILILVVIYTLIKNMFYVHIVNI